MPAGMQGFINAGGRAGSPQMGKSTTQRNRAQIGANAKVPVQRTALGYPQPGQQNASARRQSAGSVNQQQSQPPRRSTEGHGPGYDRYDTDAESLDTTIHGQSIIQVQDSQQTGQQQLATDSPEYEDTEEESSEDHDHNANDERLHTLEEYIEACNLHNLPLEEQIRWLEQQGYVWDDGNSYPTTTTGPPEGFPDDWNADQETPSDGTQNERPSSPSPQRLPVRGQAARSMAQGPPADPKPKRAMEKNSIFHEGAGIRKDQRANTNLAMRGGGHSQMNAPPLASGEPPTFSQANREPDRPASYDQRQIPRVQVGPLPLQGLRPPQRSSRGLPTMSIELHAPAARAAPTRLKEQPMPHRHPVEEARINESALGPVEDYDRPALFDMNYDDLKNENFDTVPRGKQEVLSDDMRQKPLVERLEHVQKGLDLADQDRFFRSLPTREWEEAGDWFLDKFSSILQRTKEARQKKRKLASDFEDEVEKRYRQVARKEQIVQDALDKMKLQGESLVSKSPRASKSPRKVK